MIVIAKEPVPGRVKTRLCPPCTPAQSAKLAEAALADTLVAVEHTPAARRVLALEGEPGEWLPPGFDVVRQSRGGLGARLAAAFRATGGPALLIGMDTPQVTPELLASAARELLGHNTDAVLGPALDGGYWAIGLKRAHPEAFDGVPMSSTRTYEAQCRQLHALGLRRTELATVRDVDTFADAQHVAAECQPGSRFRTGLANLDEDREVSAPIDGRTQWAAV